MGGGISRIGAMKAGYWLQQEILPPEWGYISQGILCVHGRYSGHMGDIWRAAMGNMRYKMNRSGQRRTRAVNRRDMGGSRVHMRNTT